MDSTTVQNTQHDREEREIMLFQMCLLELRKERIANQLQQEQITALWAYIQQLTLALQEQKESKWINSNYL